MTYALLQGVAQTRLAREASFSLSFVMPDPPLLRILFKPTPMNPLPQLISRQDTFHEAGVPSARLAGKEVSH